MFDFPSRSVRNAVQYRGAVSSMSFNSSKPIDSMIIRVYLLFVTYFIVLQLIPFSVVAHAASSLLFFHCGSI